MVCSIVQLHSVSGMISSSCSAHQRRLTPPYQQFRHQGCPNCESFLQLANNEDAIQDCTSQVFEGVITLANPERSWVAKWQRLDKYVPGNYAVKVVGVVSHLKEPYYPADNA